VSISCILLSFAISVHSVLYTSRPRPTESDKPVG